jgi:hypothetical protein
VTRRGETAYGNQAHHPAAGTSPATDAALRAGGARDKPAGGPPPQGHAPADPAESAPTAGPAPAGVPGGDRAPGYYLNSGIVPNGRPLFAPSDGRQALRAAMARDRRTFTMALSATAAGVTAAVLFGTFAPLHSTWTPSGGSGAAGGGLPPQTPAPWSAAPLGIQSGQAVAQGPSLGSSLGSSLGPAQAQPWRPGERPVPPHPARHTRPPRHARPPRPERPPGTSRETGPSQEAHGRHGAAAAIAPGRHRRPPALVVRYRVDRQWPGDFQGEVQVINHGTRPIAGWQVVVALPADTVTSVWNANGFVSNHILLLAACCSGRPARPRSCRPAAARWTSSSSPRVPRRSRRPAPSTGHPAASRGKQDVPAGAQGPAGTSHGVLRYHLPEAAICRSCRPVSVRAVTTSAR